MALSLVHFLERAATLSPQAPAVARPGDTALSYRDVDERSRRLAAVLVALGVSRSDRVGVLMAKSSEAVVVLWAILRAGAAYVPIDVFAPPERISFIAANCGMKVLMLSPEFEGIGSAVQRKVPQLTLLDPSADPSGSAGHARAPHAKDLAYILYTSGSTGQPKGVMVSHGAAVSFVEWAAWRFGLLASDVLTSHAPFHFDLSIFDIFGAASVGARVVLLDEETVRFPMMVVEAIEREQVTITYQVPSALRQAARLERWQSGNRESLRLVLFAGESYPAHELAHLQRSLPEAQLVNLYGPTETNVCTYWTVPPDGTWREVSIGIACENCETMVVDERLQPVHDGSPGELLVRGGTVMEGYWGDPERTDGTLVRTAQYPHLTDRWHKTGDIVSQRTDGHYILHGRRDHMVKIRGYRIELGEVESVIGATDGVLEAAVIATSESEDLDARLVAFVVGTDQTDGERIIEAISRQLESTLPKYMRPSQIDLLTALPRTSNGKVDRRGLAARVGGERR